MTQVLPAIIPRMKSQLEDEIKLVARFADMVQIDISDGIFTPYKTWPYNGQDLEYFEQLKTEDAGWPKWEEVEFEIHLMVKNPEDVVAAWIQTGITSIVAHIEATENFQKVIDICREHNVEVGVAIKPATDIAKLEPFASQVDFIQVMGSDMLGKHGVELEQTAVEKIKKLHALYPEGIIAIDIGVSEDSVEMLVAAGASKLISGSEILNSESPEETFENLQAAH